MKNFKTIFPFFFCLAAIFIASSCEEFFKKKGQVTFGSNFHVVNCISTVTIYLDGQNIGTLSNSVDSIYDCGLKENITKEISVGKHHYKIEIRPQYGDGCTKDLSGTFTISENECKKIFIDYLQVFNKTNNCDKDVIISCEEYKTAPDDFVVVNSLKIEDDCLKVNFSASACSGSTWIVKLIDSGIVAESYPCQRSLRLSLENKEMCEAWITKEFLFNIKELQIAGNDKVFLNISGKQILYEY